MAAPTSGERGGGSRSAWLLSQQCLPLQYQKTSQNNTICQQKVTHAEWLRRIGLETTIPAGLAFVGGTGEVATNLEELEAAGDRGTFRQTWTTHPHPYQTACGAKPLPAALPISPCSSQSWERTQVSRPPAPPHCLQELEEGVSVLFCDCVVHPRCLTKPHCHCYHWHQHQEADWEGKQ
ncbi:uncharacterized protein LOC112551239 isoform X3 [Alligator sinensis]|uniref:Uncharacterized protein LOC112551239 isoform X3 n=1 Tax=Alligator sinensis TaxID=38654 RepID=A0A3Q0H5J0_ALLSI|nr:uncharacterized protein LOC112551239 isoform X3 [Alligator sinensis]